MNFATIANLQVSELLGHTKISTIQIYSVVTQLKVTKDMEAVIQRYKNKI